MKKYVFITCDITLLGGIQAYLAGKSKYLIDTGWQVSVFYYSQKNEPCVFPFLNMFRNGNIIELFYLPNRINGAIINHAIDKMKNMFSKIDVVIAGSGCARLAAQEGTITIVVDARDLMSNGVLGIDTQNALFREEGKMGESIDRTLEKILIENSYDKKNISMIKRKSNSDYYKEHLQYFTNVDNKYYPSSKLCYPQLVTFIVSIVLARILVPEDYGTIALVTIFTSILQVFVDSGLGTALIQKKDADDLDFSSVFYFNFVVCVILYIVMLFVAPVISAFYNDHSLIPIIRVASLTIVISGVKGIQQAYVSRNMLFKRFFFATLGGTIFSAFFGIGLAYAGFGVWSIVIQQLSNTAIDTLILWITVRWRPKKMFSLKRLKRLLSFGWKLLVSSLFDTVYNNLRNLIIGKVYSSSDLAYYNQGDKFPKLIVTNINSSIDSVLLPTLSSVQDNRERVKNMTRRAIKTSTYKI